MIKTSSATTVNYRIDAGDTVGSLAKHFHVSRDSIIEQLAQNGIKGKKVAGGTRYELPVGKTLTLTFPNANTTQNLARIFGELETYFYKSSYTDNSFGDRSCVQETPKDPKNIPFKKCFYIPPQPVLKKEDLIHSKNLNKRLAAAILFFERGSYGRTDTLGEWGCDTYHFHALIRWGNVKNYSTELESKDGKLKLMIRLLEENPREVILLYHTDEGTGRFPPYSPNRNFVDWGGGNISPQTSPTCDGLSPFDIKCRDVIDFTFVILPPEHELYPFGHKLPDGRRFIVWPYK